MVQHLSPEWIDALDRAASSVPPLADADLVVEQTVVGSDGTTTTWHIALARTGTRVRPGPAPTAGPAPVVRFTTDRATAVAVLRGEVAAQTAFMRGELRVGGDTDALVEQADVLGALDDVFAPVRAQTEV